MQAIICSDFIDAKTLDWKEGRRKRTVEIQSTRTPHNLEVVA